MFICPVHFFLKPSKALIFPSLCPVCFVQKTPMILPSPFVLCVLFRDYRWFPPFYQGAAQACIATLRSFCLKPSKVGRKNSIHKSAQNVELCTFSCVSFIFICIFMRHCGGLTDLNALGAFRHKQDLYRCKANA